MKRGTANSLEIGKFVYTRGKKIFSLMRIQRSRLLLLILGATPFLLLCVITERSSWRPKVLLRGKFARPLGFSPDGRFLLTCSYGQVQLWNWGHKTVLRRFNRTSAAWGAVDNKGRIFISSARAVMGFDGPSADGHFRVWDGVGGRLLHKYNSPGEPFFLTVDGQQINASYPFEYGASVETYEARTGKKLRSCKVVPPSGLTFWYIPASSGESSPFGHPGPPISPDGRWLVSPLWKVTCSKDWSPHNEFRGLTLFDTVHKTSRVIKDANERDEPFSFSSDGKMLLIGCQKGVEIMNTETLAGISRIACQDYGSVENLLNSSSELITTDQNGKLLRVWDMLTGKLLRELKHPTTVLHCCPSPDGKALVTSDELGIIRTWRLK